MILFFLVWHSCQIHYTLSDDKTIFTAFGNAEILGQEIVRDSKLYTQYVVANITNGITGIGNGAFLQCERITTFFFGSTIKSIGNNTFEKCTSLVQVEFPDLVEDYGDYIFKDCSNLVKVKFSVSMKKIGVSPFYDIRKLAVIDIQYNSLFSTDLEGKFLIYNKTKLLTAASSYSKLVVPSAIETIGNNCFELLILLTTLEFETGSKLTLVEKDAFVNTRFASIEFPHGTKEIRENVFSQAHVETVFLPSTLTSVSSQIFNRAAQLKSVILRGNSEALESDEDNIIYLKGKESILFIPPEVTKMHIDKKTTTISSSLLQTKTKLVKLTIDWDHPKMFVFNNTLYANESMTLYSVIGGAKYVEVFDQCQTIGGLSFANSQVSKVKFLGTKVTRFLTNAFSSTNYLTELELPEGLVQINPWSMDGSALTKLVFPSTLKYLGSCFSAYSSLVEADLSKCSVVENIIDSAFAYTSKLSTVKLPPNYNSIPKSLFLNSGIQTLSVPSCVKILNEEAFKDSALSTIIFDEDNSKLETIGTRCFMNSKLQSIKVPSSVLTIQSEAFLNCNSLTKCDFFSNSKLTSIDPRIFTGTSIKNLTFGTNLQTVAECAFTGCKALTEIFIVSENTFLCSVDGCIYTDDFKKFIACPPGKKTVSFRSEATSIAGSAFFECTELLSVNFGTNSGITELGKSTFLGCINLNSIELPPKVGEIKDECFSGCKKLQNVIFDPNCRTESIGKSAFANCGLTQLDMSICQLLTTLALNAFSGCTSLTTVKLSGKTETIGSKCFQSCTNLMIVEFCSTSDTLESAIRSSSKSFGPDDVFDGCSTQLSVLVSISFAQDSFCGASIAKVFDKDCMTASAKFTARILPHFHTGIINCVAAAVLQDDISSLVE